MKHVKNYILIMHLLKVPLQGLTSSCFISTKSTPIFSTQVDGLEMELFFIHSYLVRNEKTYCVGWKIHSLHSWIPCWCTEGLLLLVALLSHSLQWYIILLFDRLVLMSHNVVMNPHIPLLKAYTHISLRIA